MGQPHQKIDMIMLVVEVKVAFYMTIVDVVVDVVVVDVVVDVVVVVVVMGEVVVVGMVAVDCIGNVEFDVGDNSKPLPLPVLGYVDRATSSQLPLSSFDGSFDDPKSINSHLR